MTHDTDDGGPAFPTSGENYPFGSGYVQSGVTPGMSLRDYFAGCALPAATATFPRDAGAAASLAYRIADAMLEVRTSHPPRNRRVGLP